MTYIINMSDYCYLKGISFLTYAQPTVKILIKIYINQVDFKNNFDSSFVCTFKRKLPLKYAFIGANATYPRVQGSPRIYLCVDASSKDTTCDHFFFKHCQFLSCLNSFHIEILLCLLWHCYASMLILGPGRPFSRRIVTLTYMVIWFCACVVVFLLVECEAFI